MLQKTPDRHDSDGSEKIQVLDSSLYLVQQNNTLSA